MILVEQTDENKTKVRMEFKDVHEMLRDFIALIDAICESKLTRDLFVKAVDFKLSEIRNTLK